MYLYICMSISLSIYLSIYICLYLSLYIYISPSVSFYLFLYIYIYIYIYWSIVFPILSCQNKMLVLEIHMCRKVRASAEKWYHLSPDLAPSGSSPIPIIWGGLPRPPIIYWYIFTVISMDGNKNSIIQIYQNLLLLILFSLHFHPPTYFFLPPALQELVSKLYQNIYSYSWSFPTPTINSPPSPV